MVALMKSLCLSFIVLASFATLFTVADARRFYVGGNGAWVINPHESYNSWAERNRFQVNDTLYFKYAKVSDSVQLVTKADFEGCNIRNPLEKFDNGEDEFTLNRSGPFYFISGNQDHCMKGQKLIVVVLAIRNHPKVPISPAKAPSTAQPPKSHSPVSPISPAKAPSTTQPPKSHTPVSPVAPAKAPSSSQPPKSPSPVTPPSTSKPPKSSVSPSQPSTPSSPVTHSPAVSPSQAPTISPATHSPSTSSPTNSPRSPKSSPSPSASSPAKPPRSSPSPDHSPASPAPEKTPPSSPTPSESTPTADNIKAPAPSPTNAASGVAVTSVLTKVLSVAFTVLMFA